MARRKDRRRALRRFPLAAIRRSLRAVAVAFTGHGRAASRLASERPTSERPTSELGARWRIEFRALASAPSIPGLWILSRRIALVRGASSLRQCRWIYRAYVLLLFSLDDSSRRRLAHRTRNRRSLGSVRQRFHRHRSCAHFVRTARSGAVELAAHRSAGSVARHCRRRAVFTRRRRASCAGISAL